FPGQGDEHTFGARPRVSGNNFATGSNQNCGNVMSDVPSTRVLAPPGGKSSFSLGWDTSPPVQPVRQTGRAQVPGPLDQMRNEPSGAGHGGHQASGGYSPSGSGHGGHQASGGYSPNSRYDRGGPHQGFGSPGQSQQQYEDAGAPYPGRADPQAFGSRPRESSNSYACGSNQNQGNFMTDVPSTRVLRPPGGASSFSLAWDDSSNSAPKARQPASFAGAQQHAQAGHLGAPREVSGNSYACGSNQNCGNVLTDTPSTRVLRPPGGASTLVLG
ncbi:unnamed protein product, partial [Polarella glacialis]